MEFINSLFSLWPVLLLFLVVIIFLCIATKGAENTNKLLAKHSVQVEKDEADYFRKRLLIDGALESLLPSLGIWLMVYIFFMRMVFFANLFSIYFYIYKLGGAIIYYFKSKKSLYRIIDDDFEVKSILEKGTLDNPDYTYYKFNLKNTKKSYSVRNTREIYDRKADSDKYYLVDNNLVIIFGNKKKKKDSHKK